MISADRPTDPPADPPPAAGGPPLPETPPKAGDRPPAAERPEDEGDDGIPTPTELADLPPA